MRYSINAEGRIEFLDGKRGETDVEFVVDLMGLYSGSTAFDQTKFQAHSLATVMEYLERTHTFYENVLLPKMEIAIYGILKLFPDHVIADVLNAFFGSYKNNLIEHIELEETRLFPYARRLSQGGAANDYSVADFEQAHDHEVEFALDKVIEMIEKDYAEVSRSFAYRNFKQLLLQFRLDLDIHHLIEEKVFLLKLRQLESNQEIHPFQWQRFGRIWRESKLALHRENLLQLIISEPNAHPNEWTKKCRANHHGNRIVVDVMCSHCAS